MYGSNRFNQIGPSFNEGLVTQIATGDYHTVMVGNGNLYVYGPETNETEEDIDIPNQPAPIPVRKICTTPMALLLCFYPLNFKICIRSPFQSVCTMCLQVEMGLLWFP